MGELLEFLPNSKFYQFFWKLKLHYEKENIGFADFLSSDTSGLDAFIEKKLEKTGHSLEKENSTHIKLNPENNYIIKKNEGAIIIS